jgi:hypothetical protein
MVKIFNFGTHPGREDTTKLIPDTLVTVNDPQFKGRDRGREFILTLLRKAAADRNHKLSGDTTDIDNYPKTDETPDIDQTIDAPNNAKVNKGSRNKSNIPSQRSLRAGSRLPPPDEIKMVEDLLFQILKKNKQKKITVKTPLGVFPMIKDEEDISARLKSCHDMMSLLNEFGAPHVAIKADAARRAIFDNFKKLKEEKQLQKQIDKIILVDEGSIIGGIAADLATTAIKNTLGSTAGNILVRAAKTAFKPKPQKQLRTIIPQRCKVCGKTYTNYQDHIKTHTTAAKPKPRGSGVEIIGLRTPRTRPGYQLRSTRLMEEIILLKIESKICDRLSYYYAQQ